VATAWSQGRLNPQDIFTRAHAAQISLFRSGARAIVRLECIVHRRKADIPDMLTIVPHAWILDTVQWRVIAMSIAGRDNNEFQKYRLTKSLRE
jgi:hypothetical protein